MTILHINKHHQISLSQPFYPSYILKDFRWRFNASPFRPIPKLNIVRDISLIWKCNQIDFEDTNISRTERSIWFSRWKITYHHPQSKFSNFIFFSEKSCLNIKNDSFRRSCSNIFAQWRQMMMQNLLSTRGGDPLTLSPMCTVVHNVIF